MARKQSFGDRLKLAINLSGLQRQVVAERIGISDSMLRLYQRDKAAPTIYLVEKFAELLGCSPKWLAFGSNQDDS